MTEEQLDSVTALEKENFSQPWSYNSFASAINSKDYEYITAVCEGDVIGYAGMQVALDEAEITNIAVAKEYRQCGTGGKLIEGLVNMCKKRDVKYLHLEVRESNTSARKLYEKNGFTIDGIRKNFYQKPTEHAVLMTKLI